MADASETLAAYGLCIEAKPPVYAALESRVIELVQQCEALRAERDEARRERDEALKWTMGEAEVAARNRERVRLIGQRDAHKQRAETLEAALREAEAKVVFAGTCLWCNSIVHTDTCPFRVLVGREPAGERE